MDSIDAFDTSDSRTPRTYRINEIFGNGVVTLDAEDHTPQNHRLTLKIGDLPAGATVGACLTRYPNGTLVLLDAVPASAGAMYAPAPEQETPPLIGQIIQAAVTTIARSFDLPSHVAAHIMFVWLRMEYRL